MGAFIDTHGYIYNKSVTNDEAYSLLRNLLSKSAQSAKAGNYDPQHTADWDDLLYPLYTTT